MTKERRCTKCAVEFIPKTHGRRCCDKCTRTRSFEERFWSKVQKTDECWIWTAAASPLGYGRVGTPGRKISQAHRVAWILTNGDIPDGLCVLHRCDNPRCVRPDHLFLGTVADNNADKLAKGRQITGWCPGETNGNHELTEHQAREVLRRSLTGENQTKIAVEFGISQANVSAIKLRQTWKHLAVECTQDCGNVNDVVQPNDVPLVGE